MAAPNLTGIDPASAKASAALRLSGSGFGEKTAESAVYLRLPEATTRISAGIADWKPDSVRATVPPVASFGGGGPLLVSAANKDGESGTQPFMLLEDAAPWLDPPVPARGIERTEVTLTGARFGRPTADSKVLFKAARTDATPVAAPVVLWGPVEIKIGVPTIAALGAAGPHGVFVHTPWGDSAERAFLVGELPRIDNVNPDQAKPGGEVIVNGWAFGSAPGELRILPVFGEDVGDGGAFEITPTITTWSTERITIALPDHRTIRSTGPFELTVETEWGLSNRAPLLVQSRASITTWTRLEPHARTADLEEGLRLGTAASVDDAAWMLGRQWQMFEFQGEDAGSPVSVRVAGETNPLSAWSSGPRHQAPLPPGTPLETLVERERVIPAPGDDAAPIADLRLAAELGFELLRQLARQLDDSKLDKARRWFLQRYAIETPPPGAALDADSRRFVAVAAGRALHGGRIHADFQGVLADAPELPEPSPFTGGDRETGIAVMGGWYAWCERLFSQAPAADPPAWRPQRMEYSFGVTAGDEALVALEHDGHHLDWYSFVRGPGDSGDGDGAAAAPEPFERTVLPSLVTYTGMPAARWWEIEDTTVDFGAVAVGASELLALLFVEFGLAYGNDWFSVPIDGLPPASLCRITGVEVTDSFGQATQLAAFGDGVGSDWRMFELAGSGTTDAGSLLMIPDALPGTWSSRPTEDVLLVRDELANLAWAVERVVESPTGRPLDRQQDEHERRPDDEPPPADGPLRYVLATLPPANWYPLIPRAAAPDAPRMLARGTLRRDDDTPILPAGRLLEPGTPLELFDEEVPRAGVRVVREWQMGRAPDGSTHLWRTRRKAAGRGEGSSGLRFDTVEPTPKS